MKWIPDPLAEFQMKQLKVSWKTQDCLLEKINWKASRENHARLGVPLIEELIDEYALAMSQGSDFLMPVFFDDQAGFVVAGGNQRMAAANKNEIEKVMAYVVVTDDDYIKDMLPRVLNRRHGERSKTAEAVEHAIYAMNTYNLSPDEAAKLFTVQKKRLNDRMNAKEIQERLAPVGLSDLPQTTLLKLHVIGKNDNLLTNTARLVKDAGLSAEQAQELVAEVKQARSESAGITLIEERRKKIGAEKPPAYQSQSKQPRTNFLSCLSQFEKKIGAPNTLQQYQVTTDDLKKLTIGRLDALIKSIRLFIVASQKNAPSENNGHSPRSKVARAR